MGVGAGTFPLLRRWSSITLGPRRRVASGSHCSLQLSVQVKANYTSVLDVCLTELVALLCARHCDPQRPPPILFCQISSQCPDFRGGM
jgi:hypothetical protein